MTKNILSVFDLSPAEKLQLVEEFWDGLAATPEGVPVHAWQKEELARRKANLQKNPASGLSWEEAKKRILCHLAQGQSGGQLPLKPLHSDASLSTAKLGKYDKLSTQELIDSLKPGQSGSLKVRPDGTMVDGHHRIKLLRDRGIDVDSLPREIIAKDPQPGFPPSPD
jgi:putative addiction module component (TIGR02574 family)